MQLVESLRASRITPAPKPTMDELPSLEELFAQFDAAYADAERHAAEADRLADEAIGLLESPSAPPPSAPPPSVPPIDWDSIPLAGRPLPTRHRGVSID